MGAPVAGPAEPPDGSAADGAAVGATGPELSGAPPEAPPPNRLYPSAPPPATSSTTSPPATTHGAADRDGFTCPPFVVLAAASVLGPVPERSCVACGPLPAS